jgi:hypothetical protein
VGGGGSAGQGVQGIVSSPSPSSSPPPSLPTAALDSADIPTLTSLPTGRVVALAAAVAAVVLVLAAGYALVGAVMEFVLVDGLRRRRFALRRASRQFLTPGVRLFVFRTLVVGVLAASAALPALLVVVVGAPPVSLLVLLGLFALSVWLAGLCCLRLTTDLAVPTMVAEGRTVLSAWRRLLPLVHRAWREVTLYLAARLALGLAATLVVGLGVGLAALVIAIPFAVLGSVVVATVGLRGPGLVAVAALVAGFVPLVVAAAVVVQVPVVVYFRYYGLVFLGRLDERLALV